MVLALVCATAGHVGTASAKDDWVVLRMTGTERADVGSIQKEAKTGGWWFNLRQSYLVEGRDMGYDAPVSVAVRTFHYSCNAPSATLGFVIARDMGMKMLKVGAEAGEKTQTISLDSDLDLKRAARYVCGDKSAKLPAYTGPAKGNPKNDKVLSCGFGDDKPALTFVINEPVNTVDGNPALFSPTTIKFAIVGKDRRMHVAIDRFSGGLSVHDYAENKLIEGKCAVQTAPKF